jgi:hypothetical protein
MHGISAEDAASFGLFRFFRQNRLAAAKSVGGLEVGSRKERKEAKKGAVEVGRTWQVHGISAAAAGSFGLFRFFRQNRLAAAKSVGGLEVGSRKERKEAKKGAVEVGRTWQVHGISAAAAGSFGLFRFFRQNQLAAAESVGGLEVG